MPYPYAYLRARIAQPDPYRAYLLFPFAGEGKDFCDRVVRPAVERAGMKATSAQHLAGSTPILEDILRGVAESQIVVGVLAGRNPNVLWELGVAMTWKPSSQVLTLGRKGEDDETLPFNIKDFHHLFVSVHNADDAIQEIHNEISQMMKVHDDEIMEVVFSARNALGPLELDAVAQYGGQGHFVPRYCHYQAIGELCRLGLIACSTPAAPRNSLEYSWYWTPLGNCVLQKLGIIASDDVRSRFEGSMPPEIRNWRGGYLLHPHGLPSP